MQETNQDFGGGTNPEFNSPMRPINKAALSAREDYMGKHLWKRAGLGWIRLAVVIVAMSLSGPATAADDGSDGGALEDQLGAMFYRSMTHWKFDYTKIPGRKAGVACIPWKRLDAAFLGSAIFKALGFSYSMAEDSGAISVATQGCNRMRDHYKLTDCVCEVVLIGDAVVVTVPEAVGE
jgi:hypothetical protein